MRSQTAASSAVWILGRYSTIEEPCGAQPLVVVHDVQRHASTIDAENPHVPSGVRDVAVVEVQAARAEDAGGEVELLAPVRDDRAAEEVRAQAFISAATCSATSRNCGSPAMASFRLRWLSSDIVSTWPRASSPSNIQPSAPESSA